MNYDESNKKWLIRCGNLDNEVLGRLSFFFFFFFFLLNRRNSRVSVYRIFKLEADIVNSLFSVRNKTIFPPVTGYFCDTETFKRRKSNEKVS